MERHYPGVTPRAEMLYPFRVLTRIYNRLFFIPDNQHITNRSSRPEGLVQLSDVLFLANGFQGSMVFSVGPFRQLSSTLCGKGER